MGSSQYEVNFDLSTVQGRLYYARMSHRLTRTVVAKAFGSRPNTLKNWERCENGTSSVPYEYVRFACVAYGVPESWLLGETHEVPLPPPSRRTELELVMGTDQLSAAALLRRRLKEGWRQLPHLPRKESSP